MIDLNDLRQRPDAYREACRKKRSAFKVDEFLTLDGQYREQLKVFEAIRAEQNSFNKFIPTLSGEEKKAKLAELKEMSLKVKAAEEILNELKVRWEKAQLNIPALPLDKVPEGKDDSENREIKKWGTIRTFDYSPLDHVELGQRLDIVDVERGVKVGGARQYFLKGDGARLQNAVMTFAMDFISRRGFTVMNPPHLVSTAAMTGTGYFPAGEDQAYKLDERDAGLCLLGTAEVPVTSYHMDELLDLASLPKKYAGYSPCYRREAGTYGKDTRGLYRVHQFYKVEQVVVCEATVAASEQFHQELLKNAEDFMQLLDIPYRVMDVCSGDLGQGQAYKNDIEAWMPSRKSYGETHSCSTFYEFQSRRLNMRYKDTEGKNKYCHTLNNTLVASPRVLIPLLELNQNADGSVTIPMALRPYMGGQEKIERRA